MQGFFQESEIQKDRPDSGLIPKCGACGLYKGCKSPKMEPYGKGLANVLVVGEAPGEQEDEEGRPFIGKAGQFLRRALSSVGINLDKDAVTTNALICRPPHNVIDDSRKIGYCRPNLLKTIEENDPRVIVTLGRYALDSVLVPFWTEDVGKMERWIGWQIPIPGKFWICPTWHPSYLLRMNNQMMEKQFTDHLEKAFEIKGEAPDEIEPYNIECLLNEEEICQAIKEIDRKGGWVAFDYETNCLKPEYEKARIVSAALSNGERTIAYPWHGRAIEATKSFLRSDRTQKIASNLKFEERWTRKFLRTGVRNWGWDTMLAAHCLDNRPDICSLKFQALIHLGVTSYNDKIEPYLKNSRGRYNRIHEIALKELLYYNGMDAILEHRLAIVQRKQMGYQDET